MNSVEVRARVSSGANDTFGRKSCNMKNVMLRQKTNQATAALNVHRNQGRDDGVSKRNARYLFTRLFKA